VVEGTLILSAAKM